MKKIILIFVVLVVLFAAFNDDDKSKNKKEEETKQETQVITEKKEYDGKTLVFPVSSTATDDPDELKKTFEDAGFEVNFQVEEMKKSECYWNDRDIFSIYAVNKNDSKDMVSSFEKGDTITDNYSITIIYIHVIDDTNATESSTDTNNATSQDAQTENNNNNTVTENPYTKLTKLEIRTQTEYSHAFDETIILGNGEGVLVKCTVLPASASAEDIMFLFDESEFDSTLNNSYQSSNGEMVYEFRVTGKKECEDVFYVLSTYDFIEDYDNKLANTSMYELRIHKLNSSDGRVVYVTPDGEKYHYSKNCAGSNAYETTLYDAEAVELERCKKCS